MKYVKHYCKRTEVRVINASVINRVKLMLITGAPLSTERSALDDSVVVGASVASVVVAT